jgi:hypothetical protein
MHIQGIPPGGFFELFGAFCLHQQLEKGEWNFAFADSLQKVSKMGAVVKCVWHTTTPEIQITSMGAVIGLMFNIQKNTLQNLNFVINKEMQMSTATKVKVFGANSEKSSSIGLNELSFLNINKYIQSTYKMVSANNPLHWKVIILKEADQELTNYVAGKNLFDIFPFEFKSGTKKIGSNQNNLYWINAPNDQYTKK